MTTFLIRTLDIIFSLLGLVCASPVILVLIFRPAGLFGVQKMEKV